ncbi:MAG: CPBP family intramembrane metalloprotease [Nitrospirae bacterium]|nr:CPBP family intramembrane metalloprotease [Candidatus Manganitrophaceae bacterium]
MDEELQPSEATPPLRFGRWEQAIEVAVFLFLIVPSMIVSFFAMKQGALNFVTMASGTLLRDLALTSLVLYFLWRNGESWRTIGWSAEGARREAALGAALFLPVFIGAGMLGAALQQVGFSTPSIPVSSLLPGDSTAQRLLSLALVAVVAVSEETIFRGYLMLRFKTVLGSARGALFLSSVLFAAGHGYQGMAGILTVGVLGLIFGAVYLWRGSLVAPIVMHFLHDFVGIILLSTVGK